MAYPERSGLEGRIPTFFEGSLKFTNHCIVGLYRVRRQLADYLLLIYISGFPPLLPSCYAYSARCPPAQAELGRERNISIISELNLGP